MRLRPSWGRRSLSSNPRRAARRTFTFSRGRQATAKTPRMPDGLQNTLKPAQITSFVTTDPVAGSGTATDLALGTDPTGTDTISSPYVDYAHDYAYVGNDIGVLYRIKDVFCPSYNTDAGCTAGWGLASDTSWGTGGVGNGQRFLRRGADRRCAMTL